ncbi:hypothetical protein FB451DRAFT_1186899 [Mycena latifolia]|nr:hypothetical protein FB451DRAFT_1186899 [Mycena latifolia]
MVLRDHSYAVNTALGGRRVHNGGPTNLFSQFQHSRPVFNYDRQDCPRMASTLGLMPAQNPYCQQLKKTHIISAREYSLDLDAKSTRIDDITAVLPASARARRAPGPDTRGWRSSSHAADTAAARASAYDAAGNLKIAMCGHAEAQRDCGICVSAATDPLRRLRCGKVFAGAYRGPTGLFPARAAPCVLPGEGGSPRAPPSSRAESRAASLVRPVAPPRRSGLRASISSDRSISILPDLVSISTWMTKRRQYECGARIRRWTPAPTASSVPQRPRAPPLGGAELPREGARCGDDRQSSGGGISTTAAVWKCL